MDRRILEFIRTAGRSEPFDRLAEDLFEYQRANNPIYRGYCDELLGDARPGSWREMPGLWPVAWRLAEVCSFPPGEAVAEFRSSGTTAGSGGAAGRSRHLFDTLDLYRAALAGPFAEAVLPGRRSAGDTPILVLMPGPDESADSSLSFMMGEAIARFGRAGASGFFVCDGVFLFDALAEAVGRLADAGEPMVLASTAFGWVALLDWLAGGLLPLPPGSRVMETGGYKGRTRDWPREQLYAELSRALGVPVASIVSEYGMCELSSQFYSTAGAGQRAVFSGPAWTRVLAIDPQAQRPVEAGQAGLLRVIDLANRGSTIVVQTEDLAITHGENSFELLGRAPTAPAKGCSLTAEDLAGYKK